MIPLSDRKWVSIGDLEASYDGQRYVDIRVRHNNNHRIFLTKGDVKKIAALFHESPTVPWSPENDASQ